MEDKEFYELSSEVKTSNVKLEKEIEKIALLLQSIENKFDKEVQNLERKIEDLKSEIWDLKSSKKHITQNEKDIAVLTEQVKGNSALLESYKREVEAKMVTRKELEEKKYKDWRIWLGIAGILIAIGLGALNYFKIENSQKNGSENVLPNHKK